MHMNAKLPCASGSTGIYVNLRLRKKYTNQHFASCFCGSLTSRERLTIHVSNDEDKARLIDASWPELNYCRRPAEKMS